MDGLKNKHLVALRSAAKALRAEIGYYTGGDEHRVAQIERELINLKELTSLVTAALSENRRPRGEI